MLLALTAAGLVLAVAAWLCAPTLPVMLAIPATFLVIRLGGAGGGNNLSTADAVLLVGALAAIPLINWSDCGALKRVLMLTAVYMAATLFSVVFHPNRHDLTEWFHELLLVAGSLVVGFALVERNKGRWAMGAFVAIAAGFSVYSMLLFAAHGGHSPGGLGQGLQKNLLGVLYAIAVLTTHVNPPWVGLRGRWVRWAKYICVGGVIASGSRQAMIALVVSVLVVTFRTGQMNRRGSMLIVGMIPVGLVAYVTIQHELSSRLPQNSYSYRTLWLGQAMNIWRTSPIFGVGERFWYGGTGAHYALHSQPPNAEISMLATGGIVGLAGLAVLCLGTLWILWRLPALAGALAFGVLLAHVVEGQFDVFWVTSSGSLPWMVAGMGLAAAVAIDREKRGDQIAPWLEEPEPEPDPDPRSFRYPAGRGLPVLPRSRYGI
jgi:hypothetical protein